MDRKVVLFGRVFQFDGETGTDQFLAYASLCGKTVTTATARTRWS